jgi:hypothetical protein
LANPVQSNFGGLLDHTGRRDLDTVSAGTEFKPIFEDLALRIDSATRPS